MTTRGILFVSHEATRTGAPIELLHFLRWFKRNGRRPFSVFFDRGGELIADFEELTDTWSIDRGHWRYDARRARILRMARLGAWVRRAEAAEAQRFATKCSPALVYANSIACAQAIGLLAPHVPVLTHVHELEFQFQSFRGEALSSLMAQTRQFIACSSAVSYNLIQRHGVAVEQVETVYESIPVGDTCAERTRQQVFQELCIPADALLIVAGGGATWLKGSDLFIHLARVVCERRSRAYFVWIGGGSARDVAQFEHDIGLIGLAEKIRLTGKTTKPSDYLAAADVFVLPSREDSYPLICLEAAAFGKPIVCFGSAGGAPEFVEADCGFVVPYLDIIGMADRVISLLDSPDCRDNLGAAARRKVAERHDISGAAPRIVEIIERTIEQIS